jgi:hypothetical protein
MVRDVLVQRDADKPLQRERIAIRQAIPRSAVMPSKYHT